MARKSNSVEEESVVEETAVVQPTEELPLLARRTIVKASPTLFVKSRYQHRVARRQWRLRKVQIGI